MFCLEPPYQGSGEAHIPRFFFNTRSGLCESFMFGGGGAKLNNFLTKEECTRVCSGHGPALQAQYKRSLEAQPEPEDEVEIKIKDEIEDKIEDEIEDEIEDKLEHKIKDRDIDENAEDDDEVEDEAEIEIGYLSNDEALYEYFKNSGEDENKDGNLYEDDLNVKIEYGVVY